MRKKILIIEDEESIRLLLEECFIRFKNVGVDVLVASDGLKGLEIAKRERPELIFLDIMMPKLNGYDVCEEIKKYPQLQNTHIIFLTAMGQTIDIEKGMQAGAKEYIKKPFDIQELIKKTEDILGVKCSWVSNR